MTIVAVFSPPNTNIANICLRLMTKQHMLKIRKGRLTLANSLLQFRTEEASRIKAMAICERLGIDLQTYMRMCISRLIQENGIPFSMKLDDLSDNKAVRAMKSAGRAAEENDVAGITLDEINAEIAEARKQV